MDWSNLADLIAVGLLTWGFASVARKSHEPVSAHWLNGWVLILLHFAASMFASEPGVWGTISSLAATLFLAWAGVFFLRASVTYRQEISSRAMILVLLTTYTLVLCAVQLNAPRELRILAATLLGACPLAVAIYSMPNFKHRLRWVLVALQVLLSVFLLAVVNRPNHVDLTQNGCMFVIYLASAIYFLHMYRRKTAGAFISIAGLFLWAAVFVIAPTLMALYPNVPIQSEDWNLPKYVVAVGMILLLLEEQITHNKHLALHDDLTGLPNRRLFQDRLAIALERARRNHAQTALLMIDLDQFKQVNDTLGHHAGDLLLQAVSRTFVRRVRRSDTVARTGGDEFAIILESPTSPREAAHVAKSLLQMLEEPMLIEDRQVCVGASVGVAVFPDDAEDMESLCITADLRMYDEKRTSSGTSGPHDVPNSLKSERGEPGISFPQ